MDRMKVVHCTILFGITISFTYAQNVGFTLSGEIKGLLDSTKVYLVSNNINDRKIDTVDFSQSKNEQFKFQGMLSEDAAIYFIVFENDPEKYHEYLKLDGVTRQSIPSIAIVLQNKDVRLSGTLTDLLAMDPNNPKDPAQIVEVEGLPLQSEYVDFLNKQFDLMNRFNETNLRIAELSKSKQDVFALQRELKGISHEFDNFSFNWVKKHPASLLSPLILLYSHESVESLQAAFEILHPSVQKSIPGKALERFIALTESVSVGRNAPNFSLPSSDGKMIQLDNVVHEGKLTLVDFWASWCKPCIAQFDALKKLYTQFHFQGLNIIGISTDEKKQDWERVSINKSIPWINLWLSTYRSVQDMYRIERLPTNFLLDKEGKIIAKDLSIEELSNELNKYFKN